MEKYDEIIKSLDKKIKKINENKLISYSEKSYVMFLAIKKMEKNYKSSDDLLIFHQALRNWMCEHVVMVWTGRIKMNYMFSDKYDIRDYLDKKLGVKVTDEIFDIIDKDEEEYKKKNKNLEEYSRYTDLLEECAGNLDTCIDNIEVSLRNIESILFAASSNKKISKKLYKEVMGEMDSIKEYINDVDEYRH